MRRRWYLALVVIAGCGRFGFGSDSHATDANTTGDAADASGDASTQVRFAYLKASNTEAFDNFGWTIALSADGTTLAVGAPSEDSGVAGINASAGADNSVSQAGAVYVFTRSGATWQQQAYIKPSTVGFNDAFGVAIAISADGNTLAVGADGEDSAATTINGNEADNTAPDAGAVFVFVRSGTTWSQQAYVKCSSCESGDNLGYSVALSASGDVLAAGAVGEDSAATGVGGDPANNASADSGAAYIFTRTGTSWSQQAYIKAWNTNASDEFGYSVSLSDDGATLAVGAPGEDGGDPGVQQGPYMVNSTIPGAGAAYVFTRSGNWSQQAYIKPTFVGFGGDFFAHPVALSGDGNLLVCGAPGEDTVANSGAAWVFRRNGATWIEQTKLKASNAGNNDQFGALLAVSGDSSTVMVSAPFEDSNAAGLGGDQANDLSMDSGAVYAYAFTTGVGWGQTAYAKAAAPNAGDQFGSSVALSRDGRTRAASAMFEDSAARGVDGDATDNSAQDSGCVGISYY